MAAFEILDHICGLGTADDNRVEVELLCEGERPQDFALFAGVEGHRDLPVERRRQRVERRLEAPDLRLLAALGKRPRFFLPLRVEERLAGERDHAEQRAGISATTAAAAAP